MEIELASLVEPLDNNASGEDPQSFIEYDAILAQIETLEAIEKKPIDWNKLAIQCHEFLSTKSKDLRVSNYLTYAVFHETGFSGLADGFSLLSALITSDYAPSLYPNRRKKPEKGRAATFTWLASMLEKHFEIAQISHIDQLESADEAIEAFEKLDEKLKDYLGESAPSFSELKTTLRRFKQTIDEHQEQTQEREDENESEHGDSPATENDTHEAQDNQSSGQIASKVSNSSNLQQAPSNETPTATKVTSSSAAIPTAASAASASPADINKALSSAGNAIKSVAVLLKDTQTYSANAFFLARTAKWMMIQDAPASGVLDRQPNDQVITTIEQHQSSGNYEQLLNICESEFNNGAIFYLALHRHIYNALVALEQQHCADVVLSTTINFVSRFPDIADVTFKNGEPFADALTKEWLQSQMAGSGESENSNAASNLNDGASPWIETKKQANKLVGSGQLKQAVALFQQGLGTANTLRETILWQYELCALLYKSGKDDLAIMQLEHILTQLNEKSAANWIPELTKDVLKLTIMSHKRLQQKKQYEPQMLEKVNCLQRSLALISPLEAFEFIDS
ncbi:type VI secretion system protein TssA [Ningiella sp. W23]|uniref:type VI secretion system protein TssA n=1 Tax=Ningiella sp. W23 TaxID=3023715 RepID=UPI003757AB26